MKPRVVLDTNIIVSAALDLREGVDATAPSFCVRMALSAVIDLTLSKALFAEYENVLLRPKFRFSEQVVRQFLRNVRTVARFITPKLLPENAVSDPGDLHVLATAVSGKADFLVTGNRKHFPNSYGKVIVVAPSEFVDIVVGMKLL